MRKPVQLKVFLQMFVDAALSTNARFGDSTGHFPKGSCGWASESLGVLLAEVELGHWLLVRGKDKDSATHAWLEHGERILDVTASQFTENQKQLRKRFIAGSPECIWQDGISRGSQGRDSAIRRHLRDHGASYVSLQCPVVNGV